MQKDVKGRAYKASWLIGVSGIALAISGLGGVAYAQSVKKTPASVSVIDAAELSAEGDEVVIEDIISTGSRIRGIAPTGSNVISLGQTEINNTSALTIMDLVKQIPQISGAGFNEATFSSPFGGLNVTRGGAVNLRGVGPAATLALLDGHRLVPNGTTGGQIDPSQVPTSAVGSIEVIADGASAIYGADAVAGVFNVILRRDLNGVEASGRYGFADGVDLWAVSTAAGKVWDTGQVMVSYEHTYRGSLAGSERDYYTGDNRANGGTDYRPTQCNPGTVIINGVTYPVPAGTVTPASLVPGVPNRCDITPIGSFIPSQKRDVVAGTLTQEITDWLEFSATGLFMYREIEGTFVSQGPTRLQQMLTIPSTNPYFVLPSGLNISLKILSSTA